MISRKIKLLAAAASLVAVATTVGLARTVHSHSAGRTQAVSTKAMGLSSGQNTLPHRGILTCGPDSSAAECEKLEMLLPMSEKTWAEPLKLPINI